jgi:hypothetical protein
MWIFGETLGDPIAGKLYRAIAGAGPSGLSRTEQSSAFGRHITAARLDAARSLLLDTETIEMKGRGRSTLIERLPQGSKEAKHAN